MIQIDKDCFCVVTTIFLIGTVVYSIRVAVDRSSSSDFEDSAASALGTEVLFWDYFFLRFKLASIDEFLHKEGRVILLVQNPRLLFCPGNTNVEDSALFAECVCVRLA